MCNYPVQEVQHLLKQESAYVSCNRYELRLRDRQGNVYTYPVNPPDRIDILDLIETKLARIATVENISINANVLTVNISGITLEQASNMVEDLESSALVQKASVYSASASDEELEAKIFMTIILEKEQEVEEE